MAEYWEVLGLSGPPKSLKQANDAFSRKYKIHRTKNNYDAIEALQRAYDVAVSVVAFTNEGNARSEDSNDLSLDDFVAPAPMPSTTPAPQSSPQTERTIIVERRIINEPVEFQNAAEYMQRTRQIEFWDAVKDFYSGYVDFEGRSSRAQYWYMILFTTLVYFGLIVALVIGFVGYEEASDDMPSALGMVSVLFLLGFILVNVIPMLALCVRRLHDINQSGWLYLLFIIFSLIPLINLISAIVWLVIACTPGTRGRNNYGEDPLLMAAD